ncbi:phage integrase SAM-like domain-containing protein, partial [Campylobacter concisus]|uniref:phage integrase SAM-like domain-containing protein n=1 Tax=Campylobacter concisus TaxID=199 RepID=UPI003D2F19F1
DDSSDNNLAKQATPSSFNAKEIASFQDNIKELEDSGCLPITDGQIKTMAKRISETVYAILDQKYGSTSNLKLVKTKRCDRSIEDIIMDPNPPKNIKIKLDDESSFSMISPSVQIMEEYEIRHVPQGASYSSSHQVTALNLEDQKSLKDAFEIFETNTKRADKWSPDTQRLVTGVKKLLFLYFNEDAPVYRITRDNLLEFRDLLYKIPTKLAQKSRYKDKSLSQILKLGEKDDKLSEPTIQKYMIRVIQFFNYCFDSGYIGKSITAKMNVK